MNSVERVKALCKERKIPISKLEKDLGFANGYIGQLKKGSFPDERLMRIADYFNVSTDYLLGLESKQPNVKEIEEFEALLKTFPDDSIKLLAKLCKNERINRNLTEKYISEHTNISLTDYLSFENDLKYIGAENLSKILHFFEFKINYINGYLTGAFLNSQPQNSSIELLLDKLLITGVQKELIIQMSKLEPDALQYVMDLLESEIKMHTDKDFHKKMKTAFAESFHKEIDANKEIIQDNTKSNRDD